MIFNYKNYIKFCINLKYKKVNYFEVNEIKFIKYKMELPI